MSGHDNPISISDTVAAADVPAAAAAAAASKVQRRCRMTPSDFENEVESTTPLSSSSTTSQRSAAALTNAVEANRDNSQKNGQPPGLGNGITEEQEQGLDSDEAEVKVDQTDFFMVCPKCGRGRGRN